MNYFNNITDIEEAKLRYRKLAKQLHPDKGGTALEFQKMQEEYKMMLLQLHNAPHSFKEKQLQSDETELISELGKLAKVLINKQVPQDMLRFKIQSTESPLQRKFLNGIVSLLDEL